MEIKATDVAKLRQMTGAGMMDCKGALVEANGDFEKAKDIIREKGKLIAAKRADRETTEGSVIAKANESNTKAILVCLGCETDFVAKNTDFQNLANEIADTALAAFPADLAQLNTVKLGNLTIEESVTQQTGKSGEKHAIPFYSKLEAPYIATYIHTNGKLATIVGFSKEVSYEV
ncbi:MAG: translation elongation factor Ts, partial [Bacteroidales bacterium]|nr:translation elongation factor Ts [Bacteroidales bacterium]